MSRELRLSALRRSAGSCPVIHEEAGLRQGHGLREVGRLAAGGGWGRGGAPPAARSADGKNDVVRGRARPEQGIQAVEHATVPAQEAPRVLHLQIALHGRLE